MAETLGDRIVRYSEWTELTVLGLPTKPAEDWRQLCDEADAAEALALAIAARVDAEARRDMAARIEGEAERRGWAYKSIQGNLRYHRAKASLGAREIGAALARHTECAALARWREVRGG